MMKKLLLVVAALSSVSAASAADFSLEKLNASDIAVKTEAVAVPAVSPVKADPAPQDLLNKFQLAYNELNSVRNDLTWVRNDLQDLANRVRRMTQLNSSDAFVQSDLRRMSMDMSRRFTNMQRAAYDVRALVALAQKSADLNKAARDMDWAASDVLGYAWPDIENAAQDLEWAVRSAQPQQIGYDAQFTAMDISRYSRQLSDQARSASADTRDLVTKTQP
jgi:hypothetical protein